MSGGGLRRAASFAALAVVLARAAAGAALYTTAAGYQYTAGSAGYRGHEFWTYGIARLSGGWYPYGRLSGSEDSFYRRMLAPTAGLEKGFFGVGRARTGYTYYRGDLRSNGRAGDSHALELGFFRALSPSLTGDLSYQMTTGDLFAGDDRVFSLETAGVELQPRYAVIHRGQAALGAGLPGPLAPRLSASLAAAWTSDRRRVYTEGVGLSAVIRGPLSAQVSASFLQSSGELGRWYAGGGFVCAFSGRLRK